MDKLDFTALENALKTFEEAMASSLSSQLEKDGTIKRFEYTFELSWKSIRKLLIALGRNEVSSSPRPLIRDAHQEGLISDIETWFAYIDARNRTSYIYSKKIADEVFDDIQNFASDARALLGKLNERLKDC